VEPERPPVSSGPDSGAASSHQPPTTPPKPPGRPREQPMTPPSGGSGAPPPRKAQRQAAGGARPAACQGLSYPIAGGAVPSHDWRGFSVEVWIEWRDQANTTGIQAATAVMRHNMTNFARRQTLGCSVEAKESPKGIRVFIDGINARAEIGNAAAGLSREIQNALRNTSRSRSERARECRFFARVVAHNAQLEVDALARIMSRSRPRDGFRNWCKRHPDAVDAVPAGDSEKPAPAPGEVVAALDADIARLSDNLRNSWDVRAALNSAIHALNILRTHLFGLAGERGAGASPEAVDGGPRVQAGHGAAGSPGEGQPPPQLPSVS